MWLWFLLHLAVIFRSHSQPILEEEENGRSTRQAECCPCPTNDMDGLPAASSWKLGSSGVSGASLGGDDDCPCRSRSADSDGASSMLVPSTVRVARPLSLRPTNSNEEPKPLLHPEVDLASSVLETLREATDEEYQDAVARDEARSAARTSEGDPLDSNSSKNIVTIIVNPAAKEDVIPEASNAHQTRCIHPLGATKPRGFANMRMAQRPHDVLKEIFSTPKIQTPTLFHRYRNTFDMDSGARASNIKETYVDMNNDLNPKSNPSVASVFPKKIRPLFWEKSMKNNNDVTESKNITKVIPNLRLQLEKKDLNGYSIENEQNQLKLPAIPKFKLKPGKGLSYHSSGFNYAETNKKDRPLGSSFLPKHNLQSFLPLNLRNLHKLKDIELVDPAKLSTNSLLKKKDNIPQLKSVPILRKNNRNTIADIINETILKPSEISQNLQIPKIKGLELQSSIGTEEILPANEETRILNSLPSASEHHPVVISAKENLPDESSLISSSTDSCDVNSQKSKNLQEIEKDVSVIEAASNEKFNAISPTQSLNNVSSSSEDADENSYTDTVGETSNNVMRIEPNTESEQELTCKDEPKIKNEVFDDILSSKTDETKNDAKNLFTSEELAPHKDTICLAESSEIASETDVSGDIANAKENEDEKTRTSKPLQKTLKIVDIEDLQTMSDSLLNMSNAKDSEKAASESLVDIDCFVKPTANVENNDKSTLDPEVPLTISKSDNVGMDSLAQKNGPTEMVGAASERSSNTYASGVPASLLNNILSSSLPLRQPSLLDDLVLFPRAIPESILGNNIFNSHSLPSLNDIRNTLSNILDSNRNAEDEDVSLAGTRDDCSSEEPSMRTDSSTNQFKSLMPSSKPLKEIDLDIFQLQPLTMSPKGPKSLKIPALNLNTYKAKVALPQSMDFRPLKLQSSLGKNGGILGATLTLDADKIKDSHRNRLSQHFENIKSGILESPLNNLPSIDDIKDRSRSNLLSIPKLSDPFNVFGDGFNGLEPLGDLSENLKTHSDNTLRNIQQSLGSSFRNAKIKNTFATPLEKPHQILQKLSEAHEDANDKLFALHVDFSDRLSSIRDNILEKSKIPLLSHPLLSSSELFRSSEPSTSKGRFIKNKPVKSSSRIKQSDKKLKSSKPYPNSRKSNRMPTASSIPIRKIVGTNSKKISEPFKPGYKKFLSLNNENPKEHYLTKTSIGQPASATSRPKFIPKPISSLPKPQIKENGFLKNQQPTKLQKTLERRPPLSGSRLRPFDSNGAPSELVVSKVLPNFEETKQKLFAESPQRSASLPLLKFKPLPKLKSTGLKGDDDSTNLFAWPKINENSFLNKVRHAIRARVDSLDPPIRELSKTDDAPAVDKSSVADMARSASEYNEVTKCGKCNETGNENVSYKCKMVCVKEN